MTYTSWLFPVSGILNVVTPSSLETVSAYPTWPLNLPGFVNVTLWFVLKGWFGSLILRVGVETTLTKSPNVDVAVDPKPTAVPTPIDSCGLKYTWSFNFESNTWVWSGILKKLGIRETGVDTECIPLDKPLWTLSILFWVNVFKTSNFSVPIPILLPIEIYSGIFAT